MLFLLALMGALMLTNLAPLAILGIMAAGWVIAVAFEWASSREETHYGSGLPPRYYVPQVSLPPARPLEQVGGYPEQRDEAPTWIASAAMREELLGAWPGYADPAVVAGEPDELVPSVEGEPAAAETPVPAEVEADVVGVAEVGAAESVAAEEPRAEPLVTPSYDHTADVRAAAEAASETNVEVDRNESAVPAVEELPALDDDAAEDVAAEPDVSAPRRRRFWQRDTAPDADPWQVEELPLETEPPVQAAQPEPEPVALAQPEPVADVPLPPVAAEGVARHSLDPLAEPERGRKPWQRGTDDTVPSIEVPARPSGPRALPRHAATVVCAGGED